MPILHRPPAKAPLLQPARLPVPIAIAKSCHAKPASGNRPSGSQRSASASATALEASDIAPAPGTALDAPPIADIAPYIDTLGMSYRRSKGLLAEVSKILRNRNVRFDPIECGGKVYGSKYTFHQPTPELLHALDKYDGCISRFDIAFDIFPRSHSIEEMAAMVRANVILNWRRPQSMHEIGGTLYWTEQHVGKKPPDRNLAEYHDLPSKLTGKPVVHLELRMQSSDAVKAENIILPSQLEKLNPRELFDKHLSLINFYSAMQRDIMTSDHSNRTRGFYQRFHGSSAQLFRHQQPRLAKRLEPMNHRFSIPDKLTWGAASGSKDQFTWQSNIEDAAIDKIEQSALEHPSSALIMQQPAKKRKP